MYSWGKASDGQLGLGGIQENIITSPRWNKHVALKSIQHVACGSKHTLLLTDGGVVHSCGSNEKGQLGQDETSTRPSPVISLETRKITHVCCGYFHCVALDDQGQLFTWGGNKFGQLGNEKGDTEVNRVPKSVSALIGKQVVQVACGANHILALVKDGRLYSWGDNSDGQLGHTHGKPHVSTPAIVDSLIDLPMVKIAAGRAHNTVLTVGGGVVTWGRNNFGQLGVEVKADVHGPVEIKDLRKEKVKFVSCGDEHTALLTEDGCVFTFGSNSYGQLGHDNTRNLSTPTKVKALEGREVCQVACGRMHTLILVKESCELFSFGLGANGQLGHGATTNSLKPCSLEGDYWTASGKAGTLVDGCSMEGTDVDTPRILKGIFAGGDQSFVTIHKVHLPDSSTCTDEPMDTSTACTSPPLLSSQTSSSGSPSTLRDDRIVPSSQIPYCITGHMITNWFDELTEENSNIEEIVHNLRIVFSSPSSLNASFLRPNSDHPTTEEHCGVDLVAVKDSFNLLLEKFILPQHSRTDRNPLEEWLMSSVFDVLPATPVSLECCNLYYLLPIFIGKPQSKRMLLAYMKSFLKLDSDKKNALGNWFFNGSLDYVKLIIGMIKNGIVEEIMQSIKGRVVKFLINRPPQRGNLSLPDFHTLCASGEEDSMVTVLSFLQLFHKWNRARHEPLSYKVFHLNHLNKIINFLQDYLNLIGMALSADRLVFCKYPFVLDEDSKSQLLEVECRIQQHIAVLSQGPLSLENMLTEDRVSFLLTVSRDNLVNGTLSTLVSASETELKKPLRVVFADEEGQDDGGIRKEFFMLIFSQILNPDFGMFVEDEESHLIWFREHELFYENVDFYVLIGILCGLAMYNQVLVDLPFPILLYKKLLERAPSVEELKEFRPSLGQNLDAMISYTGDDFEDIYDLTFTVNRVSFGEVSSVDLIPNGSNIKVTKERCHEYVKTYLQYLYHDSVKEQFEAFKRGFMKVCYGKVIEMLHPCELQALMVGNHVTNWKTLEEHMLYLNGYSKDHPTIKFFWEVFHEFSEEAKRKFLVIEIPYAGVESMRMIIQRMDGGPGCSKLPVAHTCFNVLDLPPYSTKAQLKEKLLQAIHFTSGFGII